MVGSDHNHRAGWLACPLNGVPHVGGVDRLDQAHGHTEADFARRFLNAF
jgi:hypothetical protein